MGSGLIPVHLWLKLFPSVPQPLFAYLAYFAVVRMNTDFYREEKGGDQNRSKRREQRRRKARWIRGILQKETMNQHEGIQASLRDLSNAGSCPGVETPYVFSAFPIPKGLCPPAQGCEERATLGWRTVEPEP